MRIDISLFVLDHQGLSVPAGISVRAAELSQAAESGGGARGASKDARGRRNRPPDAGGAQHASDRAYRAKVQGARLYL